LNHDSAVSLNMRSLLHPKADRGGGLIPQITTANPFQKVGVC